MVDLVALTAQNAARWKVAKPAAARTSTFNQVATRLCNLHLRPSYTSVSNETGVPWWVIAVIHERECAQSWDCSIAQGDPWTRRSVHEPVGRGPFSSWHNAAIDALTNCPPYAAKWTDWSAGGTLTLLERYNGLGYAAGPRVRNTDERLPPQPSPYIWAGTDQYHSGKYVRDHYYSPDIVDSQLGCAGLLLAMQPLGKFEVGVLPAVTPVASGAPA